MARKKIHIDKDVLVNTIADIEDGPNPPTNRNELHNRVADKLGVVAGAVLGRIKDYNLPLKTPMGKKGKPNNEINLTLIKSNFIEEGELDLSPFITRGIMVNSLSDMLTSPLKDDETNWAILEAIHEIRQSNSLPAFKLDEFYQLKQRKKDVQ